MTKSNNLEINLKLYIPLDKIQIKVRNLSKIKFKIFTKWWLMQNTMTLKLFNKQLLIFLDTMKIRLMFLVQPSKMKLFKKITKKESCKI
jgi:hypothetical protein